MMQQTSIHLSKTETVEEENLEHYYRSRDWYSQLYSFMVLARESLYI
jgi:hypothetical protein